MARHGNGKGIKVVGINMPTKMADELEHRAKAMKVSTAAYCKMVFQQWLDSGKKLTLSE